MNMKIIEKLKSIKGKTSYILKEQNDKCLKFLLESGNHHRSHGRNLETKDENILRGKKGEFLFVNICEKNNIKISEVKLIDSPNGDGGVDHDIENEIETDVKTILPGQKRVYLGSSKTNKMWTLIELVNETEGIYIGSLLREDIMNNNLRFDDKNGNKVYLDKELFVKSLY